MCKGVEGCARMCELIQGHERVWENTQGLTSACKGLQWCARRCEAI